MANALTVTKEKNQNQNYRGKINTYKFLLLVYASWFEPWSMGMKQIVESKRLTRLTISEITIRKI